MPKVTDEGKINILLIGKTITKVKVDYENCKFWFDDGSHLLIESTSKTEGTEAIYWYQSQ